MSLYDSPTQEGLIHSRVILSPALFLKTTKPWQERNTMGVSYRNLLYDTLEDKFTPPHLQAHAAPLGQTHS